FGRRRMVVETSDPNRRADAETVAVLIADQTGADAKDSANVSAKTSATRISDAGNVVEGAEKRTKAQASDNNPDGRRNQVADTGRPENHPGTGKKEASVIADRTPHNAKAQGLKEPNVADRRHVDDKHSQRRAAADSSMRQAKAKSHVADRQGASDKNDKKL